MINSRNLIYTNILDLTHIAIEYVSHDNDRDQQYRVYLWK